jgi:hypothetical protein
MGDNVTNFAGVIENIEKNISSGIDIKTVMNNFCDIFVNVVKGIKNLKLRQTHIAHNDLHCGNIFVQRLSDNTYNTFIYDFDRSYDDREDNPTLNDEICEGLCYATQCNRYDNWLDFFKILYYILFGISELPFQLLLLNIVTGNATDFDFVEFIETIGQSSTFTNPDNDCSWYWDDSSEQFATKEKFVKLLKNYDTVIQRLDSYRTQSKLSFLFLSPKNIDLLNYKLLSDKMYNKLDKKSVDKMYNKLDKKSVVSSSSNKLIIDLITGKYIDRSIKRPKIHSTVINTIKKFEEVIEKNNEMKAIPRKSKR